MAKHTKWILPLGSATAAAVLLTAIWFGWIMLVNGSPAGAVVNVNSPLVMKFYSSVVGLSDDADVVVMGTVKGVAETGIDRGSEDGKGAPGNGIPVPYTVYSVEVMETLKGEVNEKIYVVRTDPEFFPDEALTRLRRDETVILYLSEETTKVAPTIAVTDTFYVPLAFDNAVFDLLSSSDLGPVGRVNDEATVVPRGTGPDMFAAGTTFTMSDIRQAIGSDGEDVGPIGNAN